MHILILNWRDSKHPLSGGAEQSLFEHAKYWKSRGATIEWFSSSFQNARREDEICGIPIVRRGSQYTVHLWFAYLFLTKKIKKPDIIIDCFHFIPFFTPLYIKDIRIIAFIHEVAGKLWFSNMFFPFALVGFSLEPLFLKVYGSKVFITVSDSTKKELIKYGLQSKNINVVHNGVSVEKVAKDIKKEKNPTLLFLARIAKDKGISDLLEAFNDIFFQIPHVQLWIVGKEEKRGAYTYFLRNAISDERIRRNIHYFHFVPNKKKFELLKRAWILIHPSEKEGWGMTVLEAASQGTPTVAYNVEGLRDAIVHKKTGILTARNVRSLSRATVALISSHEEYKKLAREAAKKAKMFTWYQSGLASWSIINA